jgi:hypothetical protein
MDSVILSLLRKIPFQQFLLAISGDSRASNLRRTRVRNCVPSHVVL